MALLAVALAIGAFAAAGWIAWRYWTDAPAPAPAIPPSPPPRISGSAENWCRVLPGEALLQHCHAGPTLDQILRQSRLAPDVFDRDLRRALVEYAAFVQLVPASESHHHAHPGGLLAHTLEVLLAAMTLRNGYLLPLGAPTEDIDRQRDHWTYAVFLGALLHDIGKILTDLRLTVRDTPQSPGRRWLPLSGALPQSGAVEYQIGFAPTAERDYAAHKKLALILLQAIVPAHALAFIGRENAVLEALTAYLGGDGKPGTPAHDGAKALNAVVKMADQMSVAHNLQYGPRARFATAAAVPLIERLMGALRGMLADGRLPLNRDGAAGWVYDGAVFFVAKRLADAVREHIERGEPEDAAGIPGRAKNDRLFDTWQDYGAIDVNPATGQAIWHVVVEGEGYEHALAMLRFPLHRLYDDLARYPTDMVGRVVPVDKTSKGKRGAGSAVAEGPTTETDGAGNVAPCAPRPIPEAPPAALSPKDRARQSENDDLIEPAEDVPFAPPPIPTDALTPTRDATDARRASPGRREIQAPRPARKAEGRKLAQAPAAARSDSSHGNRRGPPTPAAVSTPKATAPADAGEFLDDADAVVERRRERKPNKPTPVTAPVAPYAVAPRIRSRTVAEPTRLAIAFMEWVQHGLAGGSLTYNEPGSPVHFIAGGMALVSPRIFRDYAQQAGAEGNTVQQEVIAAGWHVKGAGNSNILHFAVVKRDGARAGKLSAVVIAEPIRWVTPLPPVNGCIVPFELAGFQQG